MPPCGAVKFLLNQTLFCLITPQTPYPAYTVVLLSLILIRPQPCGNVDT
ncbi:hypothetical protein SARI_01509 [Salmonella enterica subsp. arizonae serovar 62:z4,z23:-]|uniref:Uncharacterized protein n=1 Tax=Salmonella arizonae (strain ATCC BAA-731 / CDC346-86 / RSK2980) TaxID=41514 RepID=A9MRV2_SALAR|nr:hypothetical protein SARI_01509 [Salmonella enterica subsp. arizonae serovar 62:z4,z23:-]